MHHFLYLLLLATNIRALSISFNTSARMGCRPKYHLTAAYAADFYTPFHKVVQNRLFFGTTQTAVLRMKQISIAEDYSDL